MNYRFHIILGLIIGFIFVFLMNYSIGWYSFGLVSILTYFAIISLFSILPDIDMPQSKISYIFITVAVIGIVISVYPLRYPMLITFVALLVLTYIFGHVCSHRGVIHSILIGLVFSLPVLWILNFQAFILTFFSYWLHLLFDGIPFKLV